MNTSESRETRQKERIWMGTQIFLRCLAILVALWLAYQILYGLRTILLLLTLSVFFCYFIAPLVKFCENPIYLGGRELKLPRGVAILVVYLLFGGALFLVLQLVIPVIGQQASSLVKELPDYLSKWSASANKTIQGANKALHGLKVPGTSDSDLVKWATDLVASLLPKIQDTVSALLSYLIYLPWLVLVPILSFFMLKDAENFSNELVSLFPNPRLQRRIHRLLLDISKTLAAYIRAQITSCLVVGSIVTTGLMVIGVPYAAVIGALAGVFEFVPLVGPLISITIAFFLALITSLKLALVVITFMLVLRMIQDYVIYPRIIGHGIKIHPFLVIVAILCGAELGGVVGVFLAIPLIGLFIVSFQHYTAYKRTVVLGITDTGELAVPSGIASTPPPPGTP